MGWLQVSILVPNVGHPPLLCVLRVTSARFSERQLDECLHPAVLCLVSDWILQQQKAAEAEETAEGEDNRREVNRQIRRVPPGEGRFSLGSVLGLSSSAGVVCRRTDLGCTCSSAPSVSSLWLDQC